MKQLYKVLPLCLGFALAGCLGGGGQASQDNALTNAAKDQGYMADDRPAPKATTQKAVEPAAAELVAAAGGDCPKGKKGQKCRDAAKKSGATTPQKTAEPTTPAAQSDGTTKDGRPLYKVSSSDGQYQGEVWGNIRKGSKFAKVKIGMSKRQVDDLIGYSKDNKFYITGKAFIPGFGAFSKDNRRTEHFYPNEGRLVFANGDRLIRIDVDPTEDGYQ